MLYCIGCDQQVACARFSAIQHVSGCLKRQGVHRHEEILSVGVNSCCGCAHLLYSILLGDVAL
jgi:hypothetical protein